MTRTITAAQTRPMPWAGPTLASLAAVALLLTGLSQSSFAALTDLSPTPIAANAAVQAKPNIMLLMDTSGSMAWTHMPDEVEKVGAIDYTGSIGYRSTQCNQIYYNPAIDYILPKYPDGTFFPQPSFSAAPYAGFVSYYTAADATDLSIVDLGSSFRAFDAKTLRAQGSVPADPAQPAYYYVYSGAQTLTYASAACRQPDPGATTAAVGGGTWTRVLVSATSGRVGRPDERANFATWYSFYRTRISLIKTAASLAFNPLTDSFRVGFITVEPKTNPTDAFINAAKYVPIADFNAPQRTTWFASLFSQPAEGASPAREGLARVGRHYAGMQDGINNGMTGDPVQYSCQQNFTILTTDGYWNSQTETPGGGPVEIDGVSPVAVSGVRNPDGTLTLPSGLSPRPIWEGFASDTSVTTDNSNAFGYVPCGTYLYISTSQSSGTTTQLTYATSQLVTRTVQTSESTAQTSQSTTRVEQNTLQHTIATAQTFQTDTQISQSTAQITQSTSVLNMVITQLQQRQERVDQSTAQIQLRTLQTRESTSRTDESTLQTRIQTDRVDRSTSQVTQTTAQETESTSQVNTRTSQTTRSTSQVSEGTIQWTERTSQDRTCDARTEDCSPVATGGCTPAGFFYCETVTTGPTLVASCTPAAANAGNNFVTTTCSNVSTGPTPVASCTVQPANAGNSFTATTCSTVTTGPTAVVSCTPSAPIAGNAFTDTTCATANSAWTPIDVCTPQLPSLGNGYTTTSCTTLTTGPTGVAACTPAAATAVNFWTAKTCGTNNTGPTGVSTCTVVAPIPGNGYTTTSCNTVNTGPTPVSSCTPAAANAGNSWVATTCAPFSSGPTPIAACTPSGATALNSWTTTTCPNVAGVGTPVSSCTPVAGNAGNLYTATVCTPVNTGPTGVASCTPSGPNAGNSWTDTTCAPNDTVWTPIGACTPVAPIAGNAYTTTECQTISTGPTGVAACTPAVANGGNAFTATTCATTVIQPWTDVGTCTPVAANAGNGWVATLCQTVNGAPVAVSSCTPSAPNGSGQGVVCSNILTGPTGVPSCTPQVGNAGNGWLTITCGTNNTGPTLVAACVPALPIAGNAYTTTTCSSSVVGPTAVASCTPAPAGPINSFTATTCNTVTTGPSPVASCTPIAPIFGNGYTTTSCPDVLTGPTPMASCTPSGPTGLNSWTDTTCNTVNTGPTLVASCSPIAPIAGNSYTTTSCSTVNTGPTPVSSCTPAVAAAGNSYVATTCNTVTSVDTPVASCTPAIATGGNSWTETQCVTLTTGGGTASCTPQTGNVGNSYLDITCNTVTVGPALMASCTPAVANAGNSWTSTSCSTVTTGPTLVGSCTPEAPVAGNNFVTTTCTSSAGSKISYATTTTVTTQNSSMGIPVGPPTVNVTIGPATDLDGVCYAPGAAPALPAPNPQRAGLAAGPFPPGGCAAWPCTVSTANSGGSINSLADVAQYYYATDLRPAMIDNVTGVGSGPEDDRATWQHMTTFTVGLGVSGTLNYRSDYKSSGVITGDFADIRTGAKNWPVWPDPALNYDPGTGGSYANWNNPKSIDDFWHTAVNGRGTYFNAKRPESLVTGLADALSDVAVRTGSGSGITVSNSTPVAGDNFAFTTLYTTGKWTGEVQGFNVDVTTGALSAAANWSAQTKLDTTSGAACDNRSIYLFRAGAVDNKVNFTWGSQLCDGLGNPTGAPDNGLNASERAFFGTVNVSNLGQYLSMTDGTAGTVDQRTPAEGANLVNYLRGQRGFEGFVANDVTKLYRARDHLLGDIVNGQPAYVKAPFAEYQDAGYTAFKSANSGRTAMLYVPGNDGMLHALFAGANSADPQGGVEAWAFIPTAVLPNLYKLADTYYKNHHEFFVDGTPVVGDAYDGAAWKTILVAGLNGGGKSYYALDVTNPAAPKALWEFNRSNTCYDGTPATAGADCHIGYTYGKPVITKLVDGTWVVLVTSGYNNVNSPSVAGDGEGYLYVLDAFTGQIRYKLATGVGTPGTPSGLAQINVFVDYGLYNNTARQAYGGDLLGNVWRFDLNDSIAPAGREAALLGIAKAPGGTAQPITTRPELAELGGKPMVFVGTGKLLGASDFADLQVQSVYGIIDPMTPGTVYPGALRNTFKPLAMSAVGSNRTVTCTGSALQCGSADGWVVDLPDGPVLGTPGGERVNVQMVLARGTLVFASNVPSDLPCTTGGYSWLNFLSFATGLPVSTSGNVASTSVFDSLATGITVLSVSGGGLVTDRRFTSAANQPDPTPFDTPPPTGKRISWREIPQ